MADPTITKAADIYAGSDGDRTKSYYVELERRGPIGLIAMNLFRAQKCSSRAKVYRRRAHKSDAYDRKNWSLQQLCSILMEHGASWSVNFGWKQDPKTPGYEWVLYVDLPQGQVSFHSAVRGLGPDYAGEFDGQRKSAERILKFCDTVMLIHEDAWIAAREFSRLLDGEHKESQEENRSQTVSHMKQPLLFSSLEPS